MNRFEDLMEALKARGKEDDQLRKLLPELDSLDPIAPIARREGSFRLPYSSDPVPIEEAWSN